MSDSESDTQLTNVYSFRNENTIVRAKGPDINTSNMGMSFRSQRLNIPHNYERPRYAQSVCSQRNGYSREMSPVSMYSASDYRHQSHRSFYPDMGYSQRSVMLGRSTSPASVRTMDSNVSMSAASIAQAFQSEHFNKHELRMIKEAYEKYMRCRMRKRIEKKRNRRLFLKRSRRKSGYDSGELGSNSSVSSDDCRSVRSGITTYKSFRHHRSMYKENIPYGKRNNDSGINKTNLTNIKEKIINSDIFNDCTEKIRRNSFRNMLDQESRNKSGQFETTHCLTEQHLQRNGDLSEKNMSRLKHKSETLVQPRCNSAMNSTTQNEIFKKPSAPVTSNVSHISFSNQSERFKSKNLLSTTNVTEKSFVTLGERFKNSSLLPSQRFKKPFKALPTVPERETDKPKEIINRIATKPNPITVNEKIAPSNHVKTISDSRIRNVFDTDSEQEDPCHNVTVKDNGNKILAPRNKRNSDSLEDSPVLESKRSKIAEEHPKTNSDKPVANNKKKHINKSDFEFAIPTCPIKKVENQISTEKEKLISKSAQPLIPVFEINDKSKISNDTIMQNQSKHETLGGIKSSTHINNLLDNEDKTQNDEISHNFTTDVSMRPSFMKRKLFTQTLDMTENKNNISSDSLSTNSPKTDIYAPLQEKHKTRKLTSNQSCLSRDINMDDNNLLDLIHKIVPAECINITTVTNKSTKSKSRPNSKKFNETENNNDKWDITSVISTCNTEQFSDTYTDEEIFDNNKKTETKAKKNVEPIEKTKGLLIDNKISAKCKVIAEKTPMFPKFNSPIKTACSGKVVDKTAAYVNNFWDTDAETDVECNLILHRSNRLTCSRKMDESDSTSFNDRTLNKTSGVTNVNHNKANEKDKGTKHLTQPNKVPADTKKVISNKSIVYEDTTVNNVPRDNSLNTTRSGRIKKPTKILEEFLEKNKSVTKNKRGRPKKDVAQNESKKDKESNNSEIENCSKKTTKQDAKVTSSNNDKINENKITSSKTTQKKNDTTTSKVDNINTIVNEVNDIQNTKDNTKKTTNNKSNTRKTNTSVSEASNKKPNNTKAKKTNVEKNNNKRNKNNNITTKELNESNISTRSRKALASKTIKNPVSELNVMIENISPIKKCEQNNKTIITKNKVQNKNNQFKKLVELETSYTSNDSLQVRSLRGRQITFDSDQNSSLKLHRRRERKRTIK